jgi:hypothetical protein
MHCKKSLTFMTRKNPGCLMSLSEFRWTLSQNSLKHIKPGPSRENQDEWDPYESLTKKRKIRRGGTSYYVKILNGQKARVC